MRNNDVIIFDLDGTLCDVQHRRRYVMTEPKNWDAFNAACVLDKPLPHVLAIFNLIKNHHHAQIVFCSGRSGEFEKETREWISFFLDMKHEDIILFIRHQDDRRSDNIVKKEFLDHMRIELGWNILFAFDDRNQVVDMWRENGVPVFQVAEGNF